LGAFKKQDTERWDNGENTLIAFGVKVLSPAASLKKWPAHQSMLGKCYKAKMRSSTECDLL